MQEVLGNDSKDVLVRQIDMPNVEQEMQEAQRLLATEIAVTDEISHVTAVGVIKQADEYIKRIDAKFAPIKEPLNAAVKSLNGLMKELKEPAETVRETLRKRCLEWKIAEDRRIKEEQARLIEEAKQKAAEWTPLDDEPAPQITIPAPIKSSASGMRKTPWKARITDMDKLWEAAIKDPRYREYFIPDQKALDAKAKSMGAMMNIPGVEAYQEQTLVIK